MITEIVHIDNVFDYDTDFTTNLCKITTVIERRFVVICYIDSIIFWNNWHSFEDEQIDLLISTISECIVNSLTEPN